MDADAARERAAPAHLRSELHLATPSDEMVRHSETDDPPAADRRFVCQACGTKWFIHAYRVDEPDLTKCERCGGTLGKLEDDAPVRSLWGERGPAGEGRHRPATRRIELLNACWHSPVGKPPPGSCPACGANIGTDDRAEHMNGAVYHVRCLPDGPRSPSARD